MNPTTLTMMPAIACFLPGPAATAPHMPSPKPASHSGAASIPKILKGMLATPRAKDAVPTQGGAPCSPACNLGGWNDAAVTNDSTGALAARSLTARDRATKYSGNAMIQIPRQAINHFTGLFESMCLSPPFIPRRFASISTHVDVPATESAVMTPIALMSMFTVDLSQKTTYSRFHQPGTCPTPSDVGHGSAPRIMTRRVKVPPNRAVQVTHSPPDFGVLRSPVGVIIGILTLHAVSS